MWIVKKPFKETRVFGEQFKGPHEQTAVVTVTGQPPPSIVIQPQKLAFLSELDFAVSCRILLKKIKRFLLF